MCSWCLSVNTSQFFMSDLMVHQDWSLLRGSDDFHHPVSPAPHPRLWFCDERSSSTTHRHAKRHCHFSTQIHNLRHTDAMGQWTLVCCIGMQPFDRFDIHACQTMVAGLYPPYFWIASSTGQTKTREIYAVGFVACSCIHQCLAASSPCRTPLILCGDPRPSVVAGPRDHNSYVDYRHLCLRFLLRVHLASNNISGLPLPTSHF